jgi:hypothetical protein
MMTARRQGGHRGAARPLKGRRPLGGWRVRGRRQAEGEVGDIFQHCEDPDVIGRADDKPVDIDLEDQEPPDRVWYSCRHACVSFEADRLFVEGMGSAGGTYLNGRRTYPGQTCSSSAACSFVSWGERAACAAPPVLPAAPRGPPCGVAVSAVCSAQRFNADTKLPRRIKAAPDEAARAQRAVCPSVPIGRAGGWRSAAGRCPCPRRLWSQDELLCHHAWLPGACRAFRG